jgi:hypothetical protein
LNPGPPPCEGGVLTRLDDGPSSGDLRAEGFRGLRSGSYMMEAAVEKRC